jgi:hypothetical protein
MTSGVPQDSTPEPFLLNMLINDIWASLHNSSYQLFANDINISRSIKNIEDFKLLQRKRYWDLVFGESYETKCWYNYSNFLYS